MRDRTIDVAKGIAIVAIVLGHVLRGLTSAGILADGSSSQIADLALYSWHLPVFAFVSGLFVQSSIEKRGTCPYLRIRISTFLWLYILWTLLQVSVKLAAGNSVNSVAGITDLIDLIHPEGQLWFFPWIAIATISVVIVRPWASAARGGISIGTAAAISVFSWGDGGTVIGTQGLALYVFFIGGASLGAQRYLDTMSRVPAWLAAPSLAFTFVLVVSPANAPTSTYTNSFMGTPLGILLTATATFTVLLSSHVIGNLSNDSRFRRLSFLSAFAYLGKNSLIIFIAHILFASGARILLSHLGVTSVAIYIGAGLLAGIVGPLILWYATRGWFPWIFSAPEWLTGANSRRNET